MHSNDHDCPILCVMLYVDILIVHIHSLSHLQVLFRLLTHTMIKPSLINGTNFSEVLKIVPQIIVLLNN